MYHNNPLGFHSCVQPSWALPAAAVHQGRGSPGFLPQTPRDNSSGPFPCSQRIARNERVAGNDQRQADAAPTLLLPACSSQPLAGGRASSAMTARIPRIHWEEAQTKSRFPVLETVSAGGTEGSVKTVRSGGYAKMKSKWIMLLRVAGGGHLWVFVYSGSWWCAKSGGNKDLFYRSLELKL